MSMKKSLKDLRILVVEDEPVLNQAYVTILRAEGITVETSFNGEEALEALKNFTPDILLLDLRMPKMDGITFLKKLPEVKNAKQAKVIIFSNYDEQKEIEAAFALGANRYMLKAWTSPKELIKLVRESV